MAMREAPEVVSKNASIFAPLGRIGEPQEISAAIHFLVSDDASYITG
jgi:3alpha(or 20beta)-hydroxysteroid dehydrogenase